MEQHQTFLFFVIIAIIIIDFTWNFILGRLNRSSWGSGVPDKLKDVYPEEKYLKQKKYQAVNYSFSLITSTFSFILLLLVLWINGFALLDQLVANITTNWMLKPLIFFAVIALATSIVTLPFAIYDTFVIEQRFGFNKTTWPLFVTDQLKSLALGAFVGGLVLGLLIWFYNWAGSLFWLYAWVGVSLLIIAFTKFYSTFILPIFNKVEPLETGDLRDEIELLCSKAGFPLKNVFVIDGSKRSTKANAFFSGFGRQKRIVLYDTLINDLTKDEVVAVLAHEIGHYKMKHISRGTVLAVIQTGITLFLLGWFVNHPAISQALGVAEPSFHIGLLGFGLLYTPISSFTGLLMGIQSRRQEFQADAFAARYSAPVILKSALKKISAAALVNPTPHPWYVFFNYSHPPLIDRLDALDRI